MLSPFAVLQPFLDSVYYTIILRIFLSTKLLKCFVATHQSHYGGRDEGISRGDVTYNKSFDINSDLEDFSRHDLTWKMKRNSYDDSVHTDDDVLRYVSTWEAHVPPAPDCLQQMCRWTIRAAMLDLREDAFKMLPIPHEIRNFLSYTHH